MTPTVLVSFIMAFTFYTFIFIAAVPLWDSYTTFALVGVICFNVYFWLGVLSFLVVIFSDPGKVPHNFGVNDTEVQNLPFCDYCNSYKPERSHHCSRCRRCVLRMDHHCPLVNNCIGWGNVKAFVLMCTYFPMLSLTVFTFIVIRFAEIGFEDHMTTWNIFEIVFMGITLLFAVLVLLLITSFGINHCHLLFNNLTTLEYWQAKKQMDEAAGIYQQGCCSRWCPIAQARKYHPFDLGFCSNFMQVFGRNPFLWPFPLRTGTGNGISWDISKENKIAS